MKRFLKRDVVEGFLIFCVIQPMLFFTAIGVIICAILAHIWS
jgi:hypothetical protein